MEKAAGYFEKTQKITDAIGKLIGNKDFQDNLGKAGSLGALISIGIGIYQQAKHDLQTDDERAFGSLMKIAFESVQESLAQRAKDISIKDDVKSKAIKKELFNVFINIEGWNSYLPDHPVITKFRSLVCDILKYEQLSDLVRDFVFSFNITLEEKADNDSEYRKTFKRISTLNERSKNLIKHLEYSRSLIYKFNPIDKRYLDQYYVENHAVISDDVNTWEKEDSYFSDYLDKGDYDLVPKATNLIIDYLIKKDKKPYTIIGAPFGIGKTSLSVYLTSTLASNFLKDPNNIDNYIPLLVPLKGKLKILDTDGRERSLDNMIKSIAPGEEGKKRKILLICDGLDEYGEEDSKLKEILDSMQDDEEKYPNMKYIITTRLEAGLPKTLGIKSYVRLLPFSKSQVKIFFQKYGLESSFNYDELQSYNLKEEEIRKPLFCWMFSIMIHSKPQNEKILKDTTNLQLARSLIYQEFVHSIIRGKHEHIATQEYYYTQYYSEEKKVLRKIAALKQMHYPDILTRSMLIEGLKNYGLNYQDDENLQKDVFDPILTSYFYLQGPTTTDKTIDFIHKSFQEYFVAEYYIESLLEDKKHYFNVGLPTEETIFFIDGLLELLDSKNENLKEYTNILIKSLASQISIIQQQDNNLSQLADIAKRTLIKNAQRYYEEEQIIFQTGHYEENKIWRIADLPISKYAELWIHRWLALYVLDKLAPGTNIDNKKQLADFIVKTSHTVPGFIKRLNKVNLSNQFLNNTMLSKANLSNANLSFAYLSKADLSDANLSFACLSDANLSNANLSKSDLSKSDLSKANLSKANLSKANLSFATLYRANLLDAYLRNADLSNADLSNANLSNANLSFADLSNADLSNADLSNAYLSFADLSKADLSNANLSFANLSFADLSNANLSKANLSFADLSDVKINDKTNFRYAKLIDAYPSTIVTDIVAKSKSSSVDSNQMG